ncbi:MAG: pyridoxal-phosphate dependent enzyme, partial [Firmicutes bacterium]|nr:pyridoxal-phosphate dependent enzyme [Bacillota bacterium]
MAVERLRCRECEAEVPAGPVYVCERCLGPLEPAYDLEALRRVPLRQRIEAGPRSIWRYVDLLPVPYDPAVDLSPGYTPLLPAPRLGQRLGLRRLYLKNDAANPTWSFKDRSVAIGTA